jgi:hypothetical protein
MKPYVALGVVVSLACPFLIPLRSIAESGPTQGIWARDAVSLVADPEKRHILVRAPDKKKSVAISGLGINVRSDERSLEGVEEAGVDTLAELAWAPDSLAFFITESDGGDVGTWGVRVFLISKNKVKQVDVTRRVVSSFRRTYKCASPEEPNVGAVGWLKGSKELLLVAEVPPHSTCPEMGKVRGYVVKVPGGTIQRELSSAKLKKDWGSYLGSRLK